MIPTELRILRILVLDLRRRYKAVAEICIKFQFLTVLMTRVPVDVI